MVVNALPSMRAIGEKVRRRGLRDSLARGLSRTFRIPLMYFATRSLRHRIAKVSSIDEAIDLAYGFSFAGITFEPWQERSEIRSLLQTIAEVQPKTILEIGTSNGGSLFLFARVASPGALIVSVDLPHGEFGGGYPPWRGHLYRAFASGSQRITLLRANSHESQTLETVRAALAGRPVDALFIDGDHSYDGVKLDYEMYGPLVRAGGVIAFHDIVPPGPEGIRPKGDLDLQPGEVSAYWADLKSTHESREFVEDWDSGRFGIGVITVSGAGEA